MIRGPHRIRKRPATAVVRRQWGLPVAVAFLLLVPCVVSVSCTLRLAAEPARLRVGVAAAPSEEGRNRLILNEFNALSPEYELLWNVIHPGPQEWRFEAADRTLAFAEEHGLFTTASHFIWDQASGVSGTPEWVKAIQDPNELRQVMRDHLAAMTARYGGKIDRWIVVNEPLDYGSATLYRNHFYNVLGPDYISEAFRIAKEAAPDSELWLNEVATENYPGRASALVQLVAGLVARGVPIDGVGLQGHLFAGDPDYELVQDTMQRIGNLGLKVAITELDAPIPQDLPDRLEVQARRMAGMVRLCLAVPACDSVTFWGLDDAVSWINWFVGPNLDPLLFDASLQPKPAYFAVRDALLAGRPDGATP